jgi:hypothetical protein
VIAKRSRRFDHRPMFHVKHFFDGGGGMVPWGSFWNYGVGVCRGKSACFLENRSKLYLDHGPLEVADLARQTVIYVRPCATRPV